MVIWRYCLAAFLFGALNEPVAQTYKIRELSKNLVK
jgi:hypothetical protein